MKRLLPVFVLVVVALSLTGCAELFEYNLFDGLEPPAELPDLGAYTDEEVVDVLVTAAEAPDFFDQLTGAENETAKTEILDRLDVVSDAIVAGAVGGDLKTLPPEQVTKLTEVYLLKTQIDVKTTGGEVLANEAIAAIPDVMSIDMSSSTVIEDVIQVLIPDSLQTPEGTIDQGKFTTVITGLSSAGNAFVDLNAALDAGGKLPAGEEIAIAQVAIMSVVVSKVIEDLAPPAIPGEPTQAELDAGAVQLFKLVTAAEDAPVLSSDFATTMATLFDSTATGNIAEFLTLSGFESLLGGN